MSDAPVTHGDGSARHRERNARGLAALLGRNEQMREVRQLIERVADTDCTVLIAGESGTGKGLVARDIHAASPRRDRPFVKVNCAALPSELLESELFGCERGAFTGAVQARPGKFEFAHQGTMFLDEISELTLALQSKLLQVLQDGEFARLGGRDDVHVDVRVVAATHQDLERAVCERTFREDLFFRLNVVCITLPPLRQRRDEIPLLTDIFLQQYAEHYNKSRLSVSAHTLQILVDYDWPGNVRELENVVKRMVILGADAEVAQDLTDMMAGRKGKVGPIAALEPRPASHEMAAAPVRAPVPVPTAPPAATPDLSRAPNSGSLKEIARNAAREAEREIIYRTLQQTRWNRREAADLLGVSYKALLYKIKEADLDRAS
jgi:two-component system, NtrC family, response regulator AtoC